MPSIYLSPSVQEFNPYIIGGSEEYYMNLIADDMIPILEASGISVTRNDPGMSLAQVIQNSNARRYDLHLALHSNSSPEHLSGQLMGPDVYYYTYSWEGKRAADIFADNLKAIYPNPNLVTTLPTVSLAELRRIKAPSVLVEIAYHDNYSDANWIRNNIGAIAYNLSLSVTEFLGVPLLEP